MSMELSYKTATRRGVESQTHGFLIVRSTF